MPGPQFPEQQMITPPNMGAVYAEADLVYEYQPNASFGSGWANRLNSLSGKQVGTANAQLQFVIGYVGNIKEMGIIFQASGGNFASQLATVEVSQDSSTWLMVDSSINLGTSNILGKQYDITHLAATLALNPLYFPYIRITVPALGAGITASVSYGGK